MTGDGKSGGNVAKITREALVKSATKPAAETGGLSPEEIAKEKARRMQLQTAAARGQRNRTSFAGDLGGSGYVKRPRATLLGG